MLVVVFAGGLAACAGRSERSFEGDEGGNGGTGAGGSAGTAGIGRPSRPAKLGLRLMLRNPDTATAEVAGRPCPAATGIEWDIGAPIVTDGMVVAVDSPSPTDFGMTLVDGEEGTRIDCTITETGSIEADGGGTDPQITPPNGNVNFTLAGPSLVAGGTLTGFSLYTPITLSLGTEVGYPPCTVSAVHQVTAGGFWGDFACPALVDHGRPDVACQASGTMVLEFCRTQ